MNKRLAIIILLVVAVGPMLFWAGAEGVRYVFGGASSSQSFVGNVDEFGAERIKYYSKPRKVIKLAAVGSWQFWDEYGTKLKETIQLAIDKINTQEGEHGKKFEILWFDNENSAQKSDYLINEIIKQKDIFGIIGTFQSATTAAIKAKIARAKLIQLSVTQGDVDLAVARTPNFFSGTVSVATEAKALAAWTKQKFGTDETFILIREDDLYCHKFGDSVLRKFHNNNLNVANSLIYEQDNTTGYVQRYINENLRLEPNVKIVMIGTAGTFVDFYWHNKEFLNEIRRNDLIINQDSILWEDISLFPNLNKTYIISNFKYDEKIVKILDEIYKGTGTKPKLYLNMYAYRAPFILAAGINQAMSNDIVEVINYMNNNVLYTPLGDIVFDEQGFIKNTIVSINTAQQVYDFLKKHNIGGVK